MSTLYLLSNDLMFGSQTGQSATAAGLKMQTFANSDMLVESVQAPLDADVHVSHVVVDLTMNGLDLVQLTQRIRAAHNGEAIQLVAVGPHVHKQKLEAARKAGWRAMTRGQFHADFV